MSYPKVGAKAPDFAMSADDGSLVTSESLAGRRYVLYFYPKDDTAGCTAQACALRDNWSLAEALGAEIFGVSPDSVASHVKFRDKYGLRHRLLSDEGHKVADAYGTWVEKTYMGRTYHGVERTSFVVGADGRIEHVLPRVKPTEHLGQLVEVLAG
ncbi:MAG TPA: thioredoxin-dependent thiol peroxidase [Candidatus Limnocylindria bacterium]|nr:thioredoxin-dependent thiol peroxidase [Candidatus Limnocylindria bacterium]